MPKTKEPFVATRRKKAREVTPELVLITALRYIDEYGWRQGTMGNKGYGFCAIGAVHEAIKDLDPQGRSYTWWGSAAYSKTGMNASAKAELLLDKCVQAKKLRYNGDKITDVMTYNDSRSEASGKRSIRALFKCAIEKAQNS